MANKNALETEKVARAYKTGVADGARTHDNRNHNPGLYQLSYSHRRSGIIAESISGSGALAFSFRLFSRGLGHQNLSLQQGLELVHIGLCFCGSPKLCELLLCLR